MTIQVLFVCLGNICRSPTADGVFQHQVAAAGLQQHIKVDSGGTAGWHQGRPSDSRTIATARKRGYDLSPLRARQVVAEDFASFDYILAMDGENLRNLQIMQPRDYAGHLGLFLAFSQQRVFTEVPDPYHGDDRDFELVLDLAEDAAAGLLNFIRSKHNL
ncbi:MAG TPA: low molecular weight protein-tyrosine-phosphatase [Cellvibrio sp.]|nr:low molecular weight protein-tyrosine-phosphatase [Cellvibrio sp.]